ncbi:MAG: PAS domain-containing protein [Gammaproteobacteria bacterium]|nr:PAS domain-containing protein [Gammaproteobacteria bacterium]MBU1625027.1 PAS domain-containing protein [Gammaproteobacteria bacterium]MBU1981287.1 PAS domain-containing protein [Gammaproteobacteria bacterium]
MPTAQSRTAASQKGKAPAADISAKPAIAVKSKPSANPFPIVAIGASAGGLEALEQFLGNVPADSGMAYVVIQHLDPTHKGIMPELLQRATGMTVAQAGNRTRVEPNHVYVIPPNKDLSILHGLLYLLDPVAPRGMRLPIDFFFRTLADDMRNNAVGVILSGMGSDGSLGVRAIKENGGLVLVQEPSSSKFDSMPRHAIETAMADIVDTADQLPLRIIECLGHGNKPRAGTSVKEGLETEAQRSGFDKICILLRERTGHDFSHYKKSTVYRRIERRMAIHQLARIADYVRYLRENKQEVDLLFKELLIGVTSFFRDPAVWEYLQDKALPELLAATPEGTALRAWVAGCSTGEEAYSLAIAFREVLERMQLQGRYSLQIFATDLDPDAIEKARLGIYPANIAADVSEARLRRFFIVENDGYRIGKEIREQVVFAPQNVIMDPPFSKLDILTCRNLLIYLDAELQRKLLPLFHYSLKSGGILMLGNAETIGSNTDQFTTLESKSRLFRRNPSPLSALEVEFPTRHPPFTNLPTMRTTEPTPVNLQSLTEQLVLQKFSPASVLVNAAGDLVFINGRTGKYLEPAMGKANWNIHAMARDGLRQEIIIALPKALRSNKPIVCRDIGIGSGEAVQKVDMTVYPVQEPDALKGMVLIVFTDVAASAATAASAPGKRTTRKHPRVDELELALARAQQDMKTLQEEMQTSQEELKSTNEELQSTNEELQSTNEELTTSKEEMQSMNEELQTVNIELQSKVEELSTTNNDMKNLLNSTDLATVFLDNALHVRRFTRQATRLFKLIPGDVGRPLSDIVNELVYPDLLEEINEVLRTLVFSDREIATHDGRWFQVKIMPYRTLENVIDGVVITFSEISKAKQLEGELRLRGDAH